MMIDKNKLEKIAAYIKENQQIIIISQDQCKTIILTKRESEIIALLAMNTRPKEIAFQLQISKNTVNSHLTNIKRKIDCNSCFDVGFILGSLGYYLSAQP
jgi:DNA-binding CsgD family transcriptional regulator